ncbi:MAG: hypothetical protein ACYC91_08765 [Solirubrobacteraceae bacterium]
MAIRYRRSDGTQTTKRGFASERAARDARRRAKTPAFADVAILSSDRRDTIEIDPERQRHRLAADLRFERIACKDPASTCGRACSSSAPRRALLAPAEMLVIERKRGSRCAQRIRRDAAALLEILARTAYWLEWWRRFGRRRAPIRSCCSLLRYVLTTFTDGANFSPAQAARHFTIDKLNLASVDVVDAYLT